MDRLGTVRYAAPRERVTCPACASRHIEHLQPLPLHGGIDGRWVGFVSGCRRCGVVFANPMPSPETLDQLYSPSGAWGKTRQEAEPREKTPTTYLVSLFTPIRDTFAIDGPPPGSAALDFGCGNGEALDALQKLGWVTYGIEPAEKTAFARHQELQAIPAEPMFDLAIVHHVLEHVDDPLGILRALHACLRPQGVVLLSVPRLDGLPEHGDYDYCINDRAHILSYTRDAMATLLGMAGFEAIDVELAAAVHTSTWRARRRLRMLGRKTGVPSAPVSRPLAAARRAFRTWQAAHGTRMYMSAVGAAATMNVARARQYEQRRRSSRLPPL